MKYKKAKAPFKAKEGKKTVARIWRQEPGKPLEALSNSEVLMVPATGKDDKMVLQSDVKALLPWPSRGAVVPRSHQLNVSEILRTGVIELHPDVYAEYVKKGIIDKKGNCLTVTVKEEKTEEAPAPEAPAAPAPPAEPAADPASAPAGEQPPVRPEPATHTPEDVNKDGAVTQADLDAVDAMNLTQVRAKYKEVFGRKATSTWKKETLAKKIKEKIGKSL